MKVIRKIANSALLLVACVISGCGGGSNNALSRANGPVVSAPKRFQNLEFTVSSDKSVYSVGDKITFTGTVKNLGAQQIAVLESPCPSFDALVQQGNQTVWENGMNCPGDNEPAISITINPGETKTVVWVAWDQKDNNGQQVAAGQYSVTTWPMLFVVNGTALSTAQEQASLAPAPIMFTVKQN